MTYIGWKVFAYRYYHNKPELQAPISKQELLDTIRQSFQGPDWVVSEQNGVLLLTHVQTQFDVEAEVHGEDLEIQY
jgi:hypothetical protein